MVHLFFAVVIVVVFIRAATPVTGFEAGWVHRELGLKFSLLNIVTGGRSIEIVKRNEVTTPVFLCAHP